MKKVFLGSIFLYQHFISTILPKRCRFYPSCSEYARISIESQPLGSALQKILLRLCRCNPWNKGGVDLP